MRCRWSSAGLCGAAGTRGTADRRRSHRESCWGSTVCSRCPARYCRVPRFPGGPIIIRRSWTCSRRSPCPSRPPLLSVGRIPEITSLSPCGRQPTEKETDGTVFGGEKRIPGSGPSVFLIAFGRSCLKSTSNIHEN